MINKYLTRHKVLVNSALPQRSHTYSSLEEHIEFINRDILPGICPASSLPIRMMTVESKSAIVETVDIDNRTYLIYDRHYGTLLEELNYILFVDLPESCVFNFLLRIFLDLIGAEAGVANSILYRYRTLLEPAQVLDYSGIPIEINEKIRATTEIQEFFVALHEINNFVQRHQPFPDRELGVFMSDLRQGYEKAKNASAFVDRFDLALDSSNAYERLLESHAVACELAADVLTGDQVYVLLMQIYDMEFIGESMLLGFHNQAVISELRELAEAILTGSHRSWDCVEYAELRNILASNRLMGRLSQEKTGVDRMKAFIYEHTTNFEKIRRIFKGYFRNEFRTALNEALEHAHMQGPPKIIRPNVPQSSKWTRNK
ncbi:hypothetical protein KJ815_13990 [bacterium]|nr:hypothetical protein [bacterium]